MGEPSSTQFDLFGTTKSGHIKLLPPEPIPRARQDGFTEILFDDIWQPAIGRGLLDVGLDHESWGDPSTERTSRLSGRLVALGITVMEAIKSRTICITWSSCARKTLETSLMFIAGLPLQLRAPAVRAVMLVDGRAHEMCR